MLREALASVLAQAMDANQFEIIVVDNGSADATEAVVRELSRDGSMDVRYVYEGRRGLHWARHAGARAARGEILAFTDDDAAATPHWLAGLLKAYERPHVAAAGGPITVRWRSAPPTWILSMIDPVEAPVSELAIFGQLDYGPEYRELQSPQTINGGNFSIRKRALFELGGFNPDTSTEDRLVGDGEAGLCRKLHAAGSTIAYVPEALVYHIQDGAAITIRRMCHRYAQQTRYQAYVDYRTQQPGWISLVRRSGSLFFRGAAQICRALAQRPFSVPAYQHTLNAAADLATAGYCLRLSLSGKLRRAILCDNWLD
jgi:glycosyltransferase involved in cell wall biosynthesis